MAAVAPPASAAEALEMLTSAVGYLAAADATEMPAEVRGRCLQVMEQADATGTIARSLILGALITARDYCADADYSARTWLVHKCRVTRGAAAGQVAWARRAPAHPRVAAVMVTGQVPESVGRTICDWTDKLPEGDRDKADKILVGAVLGGLDLPDLTALFAEMREKIRQRARGGGSPGGGSLGSGPGGGPGPGSDPGFADRGVRVDKTIDGAGVITGDLTPECAAFVTTVLDALSAPAGADDTRTLRERYHDGLQEAMRRLAAAGMLPERAGQPVKVWAHVSLADLLLLDADSAFLGEWVARVRGQWAAARAAASAGAGDGAVWLDGAAAGGLACDAAVTPVVTGDVNTGALDDLVRLCVELAGHGPGRCGPQDGTGPGGDGTGAASGEGGSGRDASGGTGPVPPTGRGREALEQAVIGRAVELLSGPGGLAGFVRRRALGARLGGPSMPLDIGYSETIPAGIRHAVRFRDRHCRWAGGCTQPASACEVHHVKHKARGGVTSLGNCLLLCHYHHHVMIHRMGWTLVLNPDGTTTAWNPDRTKTLHSHGPPARPG